MTNGKKPEAAKKLAAETPLPVPGPTLGNNGRLDPLFVPDDTLQNALKKIVEDKTNPDKVLSDGALNDNKKKNRFAFAVVDLTYESGKAVNVPGGPHYDNTKPVNHPSKVAYAGWNDRENMEIASMGKLLPLYAGFQLQADIRALFIKLKADAGGISPTMTTLKDEAKKRYEIIYAGLDITKINVPDLAKIFTLDGGAVNFLKVKTTDAGFDAGNFNGAELSDGFLASVAGDEAKIDKVKFHEHLRLMAGWSDDHAASVVIGRLGYEFMWALVNRSGLFRASWDVLTSGDKGTTGPCGLFLAADYENVSKRWAVKDRPPAAKAVETGHLNVNKSPMRRMSNARAVAILMTMLGRERLIDHESHTEMDEIMRRVQADFDGEDAPIGQGMHDAGWQNQQVPWTYGTAIPAPDDDKRLGVAKVGWWGAETGCCCVCNTLLVRTQRTPGKILSAVLVAIDNLDDKATGLALIAKFGKEVAKVLDARHP
jgi:hypothetical protein